MADSLAHFLAEIEVCVLTSMGTMDIFGFRREPSKSLLGKAVNRIGSSIINSRMRQCHRFREMWSYLSQKRC